MPPEDKPPPFAELSEADWAAMPVTHRTMVQMPILPLELADCHDLRTNNYLLRPPLKPVSKLPLGTREPDA